MPFLLLIAFFILASPCLHTQEAASSPTPFYTDSLAGYSLVFPAGHTWKTDSLSMNDSLRSIPFLDDISTMFRVQSFQDTLDTRIARITVIHFPIFSEDVLRSFARETEKRHKDNKDIIAERRYDTTIAHFKVKALEWVERISEEGFVQLNRSFFFHDGNRLFQIETTYAIPQEDVQEAAAAPDDFLAAFSTFKPVKQTNTTTSKLLDTIKKGVLYTAIALGVLIALIIAIVVWRRNKRQQKIY